MNKNDTDIERGITDFKRLKDKCPWLQDFNKQAKGSRAILQPYWDAYTARVSAEEMTISIELSAFLAMLCQINKPAGILDLGSGFSSMVFRLYARDAKPQPAVWTVDDSPEWLIKTRSYLQENGLPIGETDVWEHFDEEKIASPSLIFYDLGRMELRIEALSRVLAMARKFNSMVVADDFHKEFYRAHAISSLAEKGCEHYSLRVLTEDKFSRYAELIFP